VKKKSSSQIDYTNSFVKLYIGTARTILNNINSDNYVKNVNLIRKVISGELTANNITSLAIDRPYGLFQEVNNKYYDFLEKQEDLTFNKKLNISSTIRCKQCKQFTCIATQAQTRSVDESMTIFITCLNCGYHGRP
jgi:DNA-directed RNA polymerase subunit M/transcription elongation factor TFIIS